jgi:hypothetical protein
MYEEPPERINIGQTLLAAECPAAVGVGTKTPDHALRRWKDVAGACLSWHQGTDPGEAIRDRFGWMDPVQRDLCTGLFRTYVRLMADSRDRVSDYEPEGSTVFHPSGGASAVASVLFALDGGELVKLRTGRTGSVPEEIAVLVEGLDDGESLIEVMAADGRIETLEMEPDERRERLARLFALWDAQREADRPTGTRPGLWCYRCPRPARCGHYPAPDGARPASTTRTILMPKTWARRLSVCERQVAWKRLYGIPEDTGDDDPSEARAAGVRFHDLLAASLLADDPDGAFDLALQSVPPSEVANMQWLYERHRRLEAEHGHPVTSVGVEYEVGATIVVPGLHLDSRDRITPGKPVAVVFMGRADATGREADGTPTVVEHRTGAGAADIDQIELDLYAVGTALIARRTEAAVHLHLLGLPDGPRCVRQHYDEEALGEAVERLRDPAGIVANWHPLDATGPPYSVGPWCGGCGFRARCEEYRT